MERAIKILAKHTPINELEHVLEDIDKASDPSLRIKQKLSDLQTLKSLISINLETFNGYVEHNNKKYIVSELNTDKDGYYVNSASGEKFNVTFKQGQITISLKGKFKKWSTSTSEQILVKAHDMVARVFEKTDRIAVDAFEKEGEVAIILSGNLPDFNNLKTFAFTTSVVLKDRCLKYNFKTLSHNFEGGNVQACYNCEETKEGVEKEKLVEEFERLINQNLKKLRTYFKEVKDESLEAMRRILPITNTKMDWVFHRNKLAD
eukprot:GAHX01000489.1.p1 GENE.GAHX01000489.1~~GAHX01000489.1.p1  ORF type:complete len:262 (+),score=81.75 GAHX01000489.1:34-819(+)